MEYPEHYLGNADNALGCYYATATCDETERLIQSNMAVANATVALALLKLRGGE